MKSAWDAVNVLFDWAGQRATGAHLSFLGFGLCNGCLCWLLLASRSIEVLAGSPTVAHWAIDAGELLGFFGCAAVAPKCSPCFKRGGFLVGAPLLSMLGSLGVWFAYACGLPAGIAYAGSFFASIGFAMQTMLWLEFYGSLAPKSVLLAYGGSYVLDLGTWALLTSFSIESGFAVCAASALLAQVLLVKSWRSAASKAPNRGVGREKTSWRLLLWLLLFAFAYGISDSVTGLGHTTLFSKIGMAIPMVLAAAGAFALARHFEVVAFYTVSFGLMIVGLSCVFFSEAPRGLSQVLLSGASQASYLVGVFVLCSIAYRSGKSSIRSCGVMYGGILAATLLGSQWGERLTQTSSAATAYAVVLAAVVVAAVFLLSDKSTLRQLRLAPPAHDKEHRSLEFADEHAMTDREKTVFLLLLQSKTTSDISADLFIAKSTVRAHVSRIYDKIGVHSRQEFVEATRELNPPEAS